MSWWWRTKPRSIIRTVQWFTNFADLEGQNWNTEDKKSTSKFDKKTVHPVRRTYIYNAHKDEDSFLSSLSLKKYLTGSFDLKETESNGRNDKTTFEFFGFGYVDNDGNIKVSKVGERICDGKFDSEDFLKQMLKLHFPNMITAKLKGFEKNDYIFPMEILCKALNKFEYLNRSEIALLFGCNNIKDIDKAYSAIEQFRDNYNKLPNKNKTDQVRKICEEAYINAYGSIENNIDSYYDYAEAFSRCLIYTGIFKATGRSIATKIRVPDYSKTKFDLLLRNIKYEKPSFNNLDDYMTWYGNTDTITLPWDNADSRKEIVLEKISYIEKMKEEKEFVEFYDGNIDNLVKEISDNSKTKLNTATTVTELKDLENEMVDFITNIKEEQYIKCLAQSDNSRKEILDKYDDIMNTIDMGALWLEVNTWKSLLAINGNKKVVRNFEIEEDLTPKSFAPGIGHTPDMELYLDDYIVLPEVSLMSGVKQWEHEASSVIDHVLSFINDNADKKVFGLFISNSINIRTKWQFFILNRESWMEKPVPVVPLTIEQYKDIISVFYAHNLDIIEFIKLILKINNCAFTSANYNLWFLNSNKIISDWKNDVFTNGI